MRHTRFLFLATIAVALAPQPRNGGLVISPPAHVVISQVFGRTR